MTDELAPEQLDEARAREALKRARPDGCRDVFGDLYAGDQRVLITAARLAREGWTPTDPDLIEAREICARESRSYAAQYRSGMWDNQSPVTTVLAAIKRGRELERSPTPSTEEEKR